MPGSWSDYLELRRGAVAPPPSTEDGDVRIYADAAGVLRSVQSDGTDAAIGGGGGSMPAQWTIGADGSLTITSDSEIGDYADLFVLKSADGGAYDVFYADTAGDGDWNFLDIGAGNSFDFWRLTAPNNRVSVCRIRESGVFIASNDGLESLLEADHEVNGLGLAGAAGCKLGFFSFAGSGAVKQTGVPVTAAGIHAALVAYGLIAA